MVNAEKWGVVSKKPMVSKKPHRHQSREKFAPKYGF